MAEVGCAEVTARRFDVILGRPAPFQGQKGSEAGSGRSKGGSVSENRTEVQGRNVAAVFSSAAARTRESRASRKPHPYKGGNCFTGALRWERK